jgi:type II secretion system protein C
MNTRKALFASKLSLAIVLGYVVVRAVLPPGGIDNGLAPALTQGKDMAQEIETTRLPDLSLEDYAQIVKRDPFGTASQTIGSGESLTNNSLVPNRSASEELGLALFGTVSGSPSVARAVIKNLKTGVLGVYKMDQTVADARIESIDTDAVILVYNGEKKILKLYTTWSGDNNDILAPSSKTVSEKSHAVDTDAQAKPGYLETTLNKAVIEPYAVNGQIEGLRITGVEDLGIAKNLGLKNNDVIRVVNGQRLTSKQKAFQILKKAKSQTAISVELLRDNEIKKLSFATR